MTISVVDLFSIGIGPSSSHTVGPMRAAVAWVEELGGLPDHVDIVLYGSLAATGAGHGTDRAVLLGLAGWTPTTVPADAEPALGTAITPTGQIDGSTTYQVTFDPVPVAEHPNCLSFNGDRYFSVGGGFILSQAEFDARASAALPAGAATAAPQGGEIPFPFSTGAEMLAHCAREKLSIAQLMERNELALRPCGSMNDHLDEVWMTMRQCVTAGISTSGMLPGGLGVVRRAPGLYTQLLEQIDGHYGGGLGAIEWVNLYALAVNEENAAGGRIVTAPTNGAAGIIPAVMHYARDFLGDFTAPQAREFLLVAGAIGIIIKENASISGAEVGCQGEVGSASAMAAAGLCAILGGSAAQIENAAEIALEHNLGLTCDPVGGLVQIPCIERNAIGAVKSINAARLARLGNGTNRVTLDDVVATMAETGRDMMTKYKETSTGGLAVTLGLPVNITEC